MKNNFNCQIYKKFNNLLYKNPSRLVSLLEGRKKIKFKKISKEIDFGSFLLFFLAKSTQQLIRYTTDRNICSRE